MTTLSCASASLRLQAFHDCELTVTEQIAVSSHVDACARCAAGLAEIRDLGSVLQAFLPGRLVLSQDEAQVFTGTVVNRLKAEDDASLLSRVQVMFEDMRLGYAGLGAAAATMVCVVIMLTMMHFAPAERPDSLRAMMTVMSTPLDCESFDFADASGCRARWAERWQRANEWAAHDAVFALEIVVTRQGQGHLSNVSVLRPAPRHRATGDQAQIIDALLDLVQQSQLDQPLDRRFPTAIYLLQETTVRASKQTPPLDVALPKKRAALNARSRQVRA